MNEGEDVSPVDGFTKSLKYLALRQESSVPYTPIKETKEEKALYANIIARALREQIDECNFNIRHYGGGGTSMHMEPTRSIERTQSILRIYKQWRKKKSRREAIKTAKADSHCIGIHANCAQLCHCEGTYSTPSSSRSSYGCGWE
jgi:hypothetical protein